MRALGWTMALLMVLGLQALPANADILVLKDGSTLEGDAKLDGDSQEYRVVLPDGSITRIAADKVQRIELGKKPAADPEMTGAARLASLRRSVEALSDVPQIIQRYQQFLDRSPDATSAEAARQDLAIWKDRLDRGLVKFGADWITADELSQRREKAVTTIREARDLMHQSRLKEAQPLIDAVLNDDPSNISGLYLRGLILIDQGQIVAAKKCFETVNATIVDHIPTLNNLAVIASKQHQLGAQLNYLDQALAASVGDKNVLDNVAEAIHPLTPDQRNGTVARKLIKRFESQMPQLEAHMAEQGWYHWGGIWVDEKELATLQAGKQTAKDELKRLQDKFDDTQMRITEINDDIDENERAMNRLEARSFVRGSDGKTYKTTLPDVYYEMKHDNERLVEKRTALQTDLQALRDAAKAQLPKLEEGTWTGAQRMIGAEGTPLFIAGSAPPPSGTATTQPSDPGRAGGSDPTPVNPATKTPTPSRPGADVEGGRVLGTESTTTTTK